MHLQPHSLLATRRAPRLLVSLAQLVGSDGSSDHAVTTVGRLVFDAAESHALPLTRAALDRCVGCDRTGATFSHVARAFQLVPIESTHKRQLA